MSSPIPIATPLLVAIAVIGAIVLVVSIARLLAVVRGSVLARLPTLAEQAVPIASPGTVVLCIEAPHFGTHFAGVDFAMRDDAGREVPSVPIVFRAKVSGFSRVRLSVRSFEIARAGRYRLLARGIAPGRDMSDTALVLARPFTGAMVGWILGIVLGGIALIGGGVLSALRFAGKL
jgi:hypothetical protein